MSDLFQTVATALAELSILQMVGVLLAVLGAAIIKGAIGFGFPLVATPLVSTIWDARHAVLVISIASLMNNVNITMRGGGSRRTFRRFIPTIAGLSVGTVAGSLLLARVDPNLLALIVGSAAVLFGIVALVKPDLAVPPRLERYLALPMGILGGLLGGSTGIFAPALASYTHALRLGKREFVFFLTLLYLVGTSVQVFSLYQLGLYDLTILVVAALTVLPNFLGVSLGIRLQERIDPLLFRRLVVLVILISGGSLVLRSL
ncbi:MAG: sulfite exporter TauE/SafE family protein [Chloroflexi bacterium]|nr:sulfite exporter TauE/SafE family protein [Chloroflexota bacterium]